MYQKIVFTKLLRNKRNKKVSNGLVTEDHQTQEEIKNSKMKTKSKEKIQKFEIGPEDECQFVPLISEEDDRKRHKGR